MKNNSSRNFSRRQVLGFAGGALAAAAVPLAMNEKWPSKTSAALSSGNNSTGKDYLLSASGAEAGQYSLGWLNAAADSGEQGFSAALSGFRGHGVLQHPSKPATALMFARRPGTQGLEVNIDSGELTGGFHCEQGRHLLGHGSFSADGRYLYTSETDYQKGSGLIVVRDADNYQLLAQWPSYGIGPHEIKLLPDGNTLVVANGGLLTHPSSGREVLNLDTMASNLSYINVADGKQLAEFRLPETKASIRHLDVAADGTVVFATQLQRQAAGHENIISLGGVHKPGKGLELFQQPQAVIAQLNDYVGSVAVNNRSRIAGFTSPRGNLVAFWHLDSQAFVGYHPLHDVCGITCSADQRHFIITNSMGDVRRLDGQSLQEQRQLREKFPTAWDNHLSIFTA